MSDTYTGVHGRRPGDQGHTHMREGHFVPEGWEDLNRGICPACGRTVRWNPVSETWIIDNSLNVIVLTAEELDWMRQSKLDVNDHAALEVAAAIETMVELNH